MATRNRKERNHLDNTKKLSFNENFLSSDPLKQGVPGSKISYESIKDTVDGSQDFNHKFIRSESLQLSSTSLKKKANFLEIERGILEEQEHSHKCASSTNINDFEKDYTNSIFVGSEKFPAKAHLVRKFLRSIPIKVPKQPVPLPPKPIRSTLLVKNAACYQWLDHSAITNALKDELQANTSTSAENNSPQLTASLLKFIGPYYKVYKVLMTNSVPVVAVISSDLLSIIRFCSSKNSFILEHQTTFESLLAAVVGPFFQLVILLNEQKDKLFINTGLDAFLADDFLRHLELALRRWCLSRKRELRFSVAFIEDLKSMNVFHATLPDNIFTAGEVLLAQYSVWMQEDYIEEDNSPLGRQKEGYMMVKISPKTSWAPIYICLKAGVLYFFEKRSKRIPSLAIPLKSNFHSCCRVCDDDSRPYAFQVIVEKDSSFSLGAADGNEMNEWIRDIESSSAQASSNLPNVERESSVINCTVTLSTQQILLHRFPNEIINRTLLTDVHKLTKFNRNGNHYCLLELSCKEATEMGGDWILYFVSENSYESFCSKFSIITNGHVDESSLEENSPCLSRKSDRICAKIQSLWDPFFEQT